MARWAQLGAWAEANPALAGSVSMCLKYTLADGGTQLSQARKRAVPEPADPGACMGGGGCKAASCDGVHAALPPTTTAAAAATVDAAALSVEHAAEWLDPRRSLLFATFGATYGAINTHVFRLMAKFRWPGPNAAAVGMTAIDTLLHLPYLFMPIFYFFRELAYADDIPRTLLALRASMARSEATRQQNFMDDQRIIVMVWAPIDLLMFRYVPLHLRTPFVSLTGLVFPVILSHVRGAQAQES